MSAAAALAALELRVPPLFVATTTAALMWLVAKRRRVAAAAKARGDGPAAAATSRGLLGFAVGLSGASLTLAAALNFRKQRTTVNPVTVNKASSLVTTGPNCWSRNPMYVGVATLLSGWAVALGDPVAALLVPGFVAYMTRFQIIPEERALTRLFGAEFERYCADVRRWL